MLEPGFEQSYRVTSSEPERARLILDPDIQQRLVLLPSLEFRLGSIQTLLPPDYWTGEPLRGLPRSLRRLWMIRIPGKLSKIPAVEEVVEAGILLARQVDKNCSPPGTPDLTAFETSEGPWL